MVLYNVPLPLLLTENLSKLSQGTPESALAFILIPNGVPFDFFVVSIVSYFSSFLIVG